MNNSGYIIAVSLIIFAGIIIGLGSTSLGNIGIEEEEDRIITNIPAFDDSTDVLITSATESGLQETLYRIDIFFVEDDTSVRFYLALEDVTPFNQWLFANYPQGSNYYEIAIPTFSINHDTLNEAKDRVQSLYYLNNLGE